MKKYAIPFLLFFTVLFSLTLPLFAQQTGVYTVQDGWSAGNSPSVIEVDNNRILVAGYSSVGYDSSVTKMVWLDNNMNVLRHKEYRLTLPLNFVFHTVKCPGGFLMGNLEYSSFGSPLSILRTDTAGNVTRHDFTYNAPGFQEKIIRLVANDNGSFAGYTSISGADGKMYRIDGNIADTILRAKKIAPVVTNDYFRPFNAAAINNNGLNLLTGTTNDYNSGGNLNGFIMKLDSANIYWAKSYDFGSHFDESTYGVIRLSDGNFAFVSQGTSTTGSFYDGFITVADTSGNNIWTRKLTINGGGVYPYTLVETANHDILVFGNNNSYKVICLKFSSSGTLLSRKQLTATGGASYIGSAIRRQNNEIVAAGNSGGFLVLKLDENGEGCSLVDDTTIHVSDFTPTVASIGFTMTTASFPMFHNPVKTRNLNTSSTALCSSDAVEESPSESTFFSVFPNPAEDVCYLRSSYPSITHYALYNILGKKLTEGKFTGLTSLSLTSFPHGIYFVHFNINGKEDVRKLVY